MTRPFSSKEIDQAIDASMAKPGTTLDVGLELPPGESPALTLEAQGEHDGEKVDVT